MSFTDKGKGKLTRKTRTKSIRKTLELQFDNCLDDSSSEDEENQAYQYDYEGVKVLFILDGFGCCIFLKT